MTTSFLHLNGHPNGISLSDQLCSLSQQNKAKTPIQGTTLAGPPLDATLEGEISAHSVVDPPKKDRHSHSKLQY